MNCNENKNNFADTARKPSFYSSLIGPFDGMWISKGSIITSDCECIVNAADKKLSGGGGVDGVIHKAAGPELRAECDAIGGCEVGEAVITKGYGLPAAYIIHTVGPRYSAKNSAEKLRMCYISSLDLAKENGIHSIEFPAISTGRYRYPKDEACRIAVSAAREWREKNSDYEIRIVFSCVDRKVLECMKAELGETAGGGET